MSFYPDSCRDASGQRQKFADSCPLRMPGPLLSRTQCHVRGHANQ